MKSTAKALSEGTVRMLDKQALAMESAQAAGWRKFWTAKCRRHSASRLNRKGRK